MRLLTAILILAAAIPAHAQTTGTYGVRYIGQNNHGNRSMVQEYDGRQRGGAEADVSLVSQGSNSYVDILLNGVNGPNENGYFDLNLGAYVSVKGKFTSFTHRQQNMPYGVIINGKLINSFDTNTALNASLIPTATDYTDPSNLFFNRKETELNVTYTLPNAPETKVTAGLWQEDETGQILARESTAGTSSSVNQVRNANMERQTRDISLGLTSSFGDSAFSIDKTERDFKDEASTVAANYGKLVRPATPRTVMQVSDLRFRTNIGVVPVTAALSARSRTNEHTNYTSNAYAATLAGAYKPLKNLYLTAKVYGRVTSVSESLTPGATTTFDDRGLALGTDHGPEDSIDHTNLVGNLKARYEFSDKLSFNAGYTYENNHRRNAGTEAYTSTVTYQDGSYADGTEYNAYAVRDTRNIVSAGLDATLPFDAELGIGYTKTMANKAVFESLATDSDQGTASLLIPLPYKLTLAGAADYTVENNKKSHLTDSRMHQYGYRSSLEWEASSKVSAGVDYAYDNTSYHSEGWFGSSDTPAAGAILVNQIHSPGMLYRYRNNMYGYHGSVKLDKSFRLDGSGTYTISRGAIPVNLQPFRITTPVAVAVTNLGPSNVRIASANVGLKYFPAAYKDLTARLGYSRSQWVDKVYSGNSGWVNSVDASVSAKF